MFKTLIEILKLGTDTLREIKNQLIILNNRAEAWRERMEAKGYLIPYHLHSDDDQKNLKFKFVLETV